MTQDDDLGGLHRRALLKRGVIVGGAAWVAPMLIDSVRSPAAALSPDYTQTVPGTYFVDVPAGQDVVFTLVGGGGGGGAGLSLIHI